MTPEQQKLWDKIQHFEINDSDSSYTFSDRLRYENQWSIAFTLRAIQEYKKFILLCCITDDSMSPSHVVDEVWHLHLLYTRSYWTEFCSDTLNQTIHHGPTKGIEEKKKFEHQYLLTLERYQYIFEQVAPEDIWPMPTASSKSPNYVKIDRNDYWIIPKKPFKKS